MKNDSIAFLEGRRLNGYVPQINNVSLGRFAEETNFELRLKTIDGATSENPVVESKYLPGRGKFYKP